MNNAAMHSSMGAEDEVLKLRSVGLLDFANKRRSTPSCAVGKTSRDGLMVCYERGSHASRIVPAIHVEICLHSFNRFSPVAASVVAESVTFFRWSSFLFG